MPKLSYALSELQKSARSAEALTTLFLRGPTHPRDDCVWEVDMDDTPTNVFLKVECGAMLQVEENFIVKGGLEAGPYPIFSGDIEKVQIRNTDPIRGEWFCGTPDGSSDNWRGMQAAIGSSRIIPDAKETREADDLDRPFGACRCPYVVFGNHLHPWRASRTLKLHTGCRVTGGGTIMLDPTVDVGIEAEKSYHWELRNLCVKGNTRTSTGAPYVENYQTGVRIFDASAAFVVENVRFADLGRAILCTSNNGGEICRCTVDPSCLFGIVIRGESPPTAGDPLNPTQPRKQEPDFLGPMNDTTVAGCQIHSDYGVLVGYMPRDFNPVPKRIVDPNANDAKYWVQKQKAIVAREMHVETDDAIPENPVEAPSEPHHASRLTIANCSIEKNGGMVAIVVGKSDLVVIRDNWFEGWMRAFQLVSDYVRVFTAEGNKIAGHSEGSGRNTLEAVLKVETHAKKVRFESNILSGVIGLGVDATHPKAYLADLTDLNNLKPLKSFPTDPPDPAW